MSLVNECNLAAVCRICGFDFFPEVLDMGLTPIANELYLDYESAKSAEVFPLVLRMCSNCRHVQLNHTVRAERLFDSYVYSSGTSETFRKHFTNLAIEIAKVCQKGAKVIEIGSNDGYLLTQLNDLGFITLGIEPSKTLVRDSMKAGLDVVHGYLTEESVKKASNILGKAQIVVGNNVFAHIDNIIEAITNVSNLLEDDGIFIMEVAYLRDLFERNLFDSIYHEHISYHSLYSLKYMLNRAHFQIIDVARIETHGGSIRIWARKMGQRPINTSEQMEKTQSLIIEEISLGLTEPSLLREIEKKIRKAKLDFTAFLAELNLDSFNFGYTAPAKLVTFLSQIDCESLNLHLIVDDNLAKQNKFIAGFGLEIVSLHEMKDRFEHYKDGNFGGKTSATCFVFAWNISDEIVKKIRNFLGNDLNIVTFIDGRGVSR